MTNSSSFNPEDYLNPVDASRATGRSFRDIMRLCALASSTPGTWITVDDHAGATFNRANEHTWYRIRELLTIMMVGCEDRIYRGDYQFKIVAPRS